MTKKILSLILGLLTLLTLSGCPDENKSQKGKETEQIPNTMQKATTELEQIITLLGGPMFDSRDKMEQLKNQQIQTLTEKLSERPEQSSLGTDKTQQDQDSGSGNKKEESAQKENQGQQEQTEESPEGGNEKGDGKEGKGTEEEKGTQEENTAENIDTKRPSADGKKEETFQMEDSLFGIPQWNPENWKMIKVMTDGLFFTWNSLQPELLEKGVTTMQMTNFNTSLEGLSQSVKNQKIESAQTSSFQLMECMSDFFSYYKTDVPPEMQRLKSITTGIHFSVRQNDWDKAQELAIRLQQESTKLKAGIEDNQTTGFQMLEFSLADLGSGVRNMDSVLVMIHTNLVTANIHEMETKLTQNQEE